MEIVIEDKNGKKISKKTAQVEKELDDRGYDREDLKIDEEINGILGYYYYIDYNIL
jgi:hypothetical protein